MNQKIVNTIFYKNFNTLCSSYFFYSLLTICFFFLFLNSGYSQDFTGLSQFIENQKEKYHLPHLSVSIVGHDSLLFTHQGKEVCAIETLQEPLVAWSILQLANQAKLHLDSPLVAYLPWFSMPNAAGSHAITIRNLLHQTTGFGTAEGYKKLTDTSQWVHFLQNATLQNPVGDEFLPSRLNARLLELVLEKISGQEMSIFWQNNIFAKLNMLHTHFGRVAQNAPKQFLFGYPLINASENDTKLLTTAEDLGKLLQFFLHDGVVEKGDTILKKVLFRTYFTPKYGHYAMGWRLGGRNGGNYFHYEHCGKSDATAWGLLPEQQLGIIVMTNINSVTATSEITENILNFIEKKPYRSYFPKEFYFRMAIFALLMWSFIELTGRVVLWRKNNFITRFSFKFKIIFGFLLGLLINISILWLLPYYFSIPLSALLTWQPDIGWALIIGVSIGIFSTFILNFIKNTN